MCEYVKQDGSKCTREAISDRGLCILHEDREHKNIQDVEKQFYEEIRNGQRDFSGCILPRVDLNNTRLIGGINLSRSFLSSLDLSNAYIEGDLNLAGASVLHDVVLSEAIINGSIWFEHATIHGIVAFWKTEVLDEIVFLYTKVEGNLSLVEAKLKGEVRIVLSDIALMSCKGAVIDDPESQEEVFRTAKFIQERNGNRYLADYHFYHEMVAKRKQKKLFLRLLELPIQYIFGYGVKPFRVISWWLAVAIALAFAYWLGHGVQDASMFWEHLYFSVVTSATPGYGGYKPEPGGFQILATIQAIFGTFMWAAFIVTFARKFMR